LAKKVLAKKSVITKQNGTAHALQYKLRDSKPLLWVDELSFIPPC